MKELFLLDPDVVFLNHGSFGACPRPVFETYQEWQRRLEWQPVQFLTNELPGHFACAREALGNYLKAAADDLVYVPNATFALNVVARSLDLGIDDEVLATDHEYGACSNVWQFLSQKRGFTYVQQPVTMPLKSKEAMLAQIWKGVTKRTRVIFLSHLTSPTAAHFPVEAICGRARESGITTIIDGAHAPGQIPLDMVSIGADFYFGNTHKWMCSPKGSAFLYAQRDVQKLIEPLVIGWGWGENRSLSYGSDYLDYLQWLGTNDISAYLSVPAAIDFQAKHNWPDVSEQCHLLLAEALKRAGELTGRASPYPDDSFYHQMAVAPLPHLSDLKAFKARLYEQYRVEIPCIQWQDQQFIRISLQGYNSREDIDVLLNALEDLIPQFRA
jgi:isopenicillin-N epimerase